MIDDAPPLLPGASNAFERALSATNAARLGPMLIQVALLRLLWDPWRIPATQLDLLAWALSVDIWNDAWPVDRKRQVVAEARAFHRRKTTVAGFRLALGYVDAELVRANLPRQGFFAGRAPTPAQHEAWLATLPEIRIYRNAPRTRTGRKGFICGRSAARSAERIILDLRRAELRRAGTVTPLVFSGVLRDATGRFLAEPERLLIPAPRARVMRAGGFEGYPAGNGAIAGDRVITLTFAAGGDGFLANAVAPGLRPAEVAPRKIAEARPAGLGFFANRPRRGRGVRVNDAEGAFYASIRLTDGTAPDLSRMRNVVGKTRLRRPAFTAGLLVHAPRPPLPSRHPRGRIARAGPEALIAALEHAIAVTQAARDTLYLDVNSTRPLTYADLPRVGVNARFGVAVRL